MEPLPRPLPAPFFGLATSASGSDSLAVEDSARADAFVVVVAAPRAVEAATLAALDGGGGVPDSLAVELSTRSSAEDYVFERIRFTYVWVLHWFLFLSFTKLKILVIFININ